MTRPNSHFQPIGELPSEHGFTVWGYGTRDDLKTVEEPGYFQGHRPHIQRGDLLLVNATAFRPRGWPAITKVLYHVDIDLDGQIRLTELLRHALPAASVPAAEPAQAPKPARPDGPQTSGTGGRQMPKPGSQTRG